MDTSAWDERYAAAGSELVWAAEANSLSPYITDVKRMFADPAPVRVSCGPGRRKTTPSSTIRTGCGRRCSSSLPFRMSIFAVARAWRVRGERRRGWLRVAAEPQGIGRRP